MRIVSSASKLAPRITPAEVRAAAEAVAASGHDVKIISVQTQLGGRGSTATISKELKRWTKARHEMLAGNTPLLGEDSNYYISQQFRPEILPGRADPFPVLSLVLNGVHLTIGADEALEIIDGARSSTIAGPGEIKLAIKTVTSQAAGVTLLISKDVETRIRSDLSKALKLSNLWSG